MSTYIGVIIEESLTDTSILQDVHVIKTDIEIVTERHKTPWVKQWTLHTVEIHEDEAPIIADRLSHSLDPRHPWYADFKNETDHFIIFRNKVFHITDLHEKAQYTEARTHALARGIPEYQLDFST